jgi:crotonobetaine/carnitine-CoA ligase
MLARQAERFPARTLVVAAEIAWTYADTCDAAARFAGTLHFAGIKRGDRVAIICSNRIEFLEVLLGCAWLGAIAVPINIASRGPQLQHILSNCGARLLVMEAEFSENLDLLDPRELAIRAIWLIGTAADVRLGNVVATSKPRGGERISANPAQPGDLALILYTSGTTGPSKGVCCPHAQ